MIKDSSVHKGFPSAEEYNQNKEFVPPPEKFSSQLQNNQLGDSSYAYQLFNDKNMPHISNYLSNNSSALNYLNQQKHNLDKLNDKFHSAQQHLHQNSREDNFHNLVHSHEKTGGKQTKQTETFPQGEIKIKSEFNDNETVLNLTMQSSPFIGHNIPQLLGKQKNPHQNQQASAMVFPYQFQDSNPPFPFNQQLWGAGSKHPFAKRLREEEEQSSVSQPKRNREDEQVDVVNDIKH